MRTTSTVDMKQMNTPEWDAARRIMAGMEIMRVMAIT
jgi:hypothetical protein